VRSSSNWRTSVALSLALCIVSGLVSGCSLNSEARKKKYFESGQHYFEKGQYNEAAIQFTNAVKIDPGFADAHFKLGEAYLHLQMVERAYQELTRTVELQPGNYLARTELADLLILARKYPQAKEQTDLLLKQRPNDPAVHAAIANLLAGQNDLPGAIEEMQRTIALDPGRWELYQSLASLQQRNNQPDAAEENFKKVSELNPKSIRGRLLLGNFYQSYNRPGDAEQQYRDAMALDPKAFEPREALAGLFLRTGKKAEAQEVLEQANRDLPHDPRSFMALSNFYYANGQLDKAITEYDALFRERPKDLPIKKNYIELLILANRMGDARKLNDEILKSNPNDEDALVYRSQMQIGWGDEDRATQTLQSVTKNDPNNSHAHYELGAAYERQGNLEQAESEWREARRLNPDLLGVDRALAGAAMGQGDIGTLEDAATQMIRLQPGSPDGYALRGFANINRQHYPEAESDIQKAIAVAPQNELGYVYLGHLRFAEKQYNDAAKAYQDGLDRNPNSTDALRGLMRVYFAEKQTDKAIDAAKFQIGKSPNNSEFYDMLGSALSFAKGDPAQAQAALEKSVALDKQNYDALMHLAQAQAMNGDVDKALATGEQSLKENQRQPNLYILMGNLYQSKRDSKKAEDAYQKALAINSQNPVASNELARLMLSTGENLDIALALAQTAGKGLPNSPAVADTLGWIYYRKGVYPLAVNYLEEALKLEEKNNMPENPDIQYHLGWAYEKSAQPAQSRQHFEQVLKTNPNYPAAAEIKKELIHLKS
jgi:cellulose synthase operon protein C